MELATKFPVPLHPLPPPAPPPTLEKLGHTGELASSNASCSFSIIQARISPSSPPPSAPPSPVLFISPLQRAPGVGGDEGGGGGRLGAHNQRFHLLSAGPPASQEEVLGGGKSSCSDAAQHQL